MIDSCKYIRIHNNTLIKYNIYTFESKPLLVSTFNNIVEKMI